MNNECKCEECRAACESKPGWFKPGEAEQAASLLGLSLEDFFQKYLAVDYWAQDEDRPTTFVLSPVTTSISPGGLFPFDPRGACVFYEQGLCKIHAAKPCECRVAHHDLSREEHIRERHKIVDAWGEQKEQIEQLLGYKPELPMPTMSEILALQFEALGLGNLLK